MIKKVNVFFDKNLRTVAKRDIRLLSLKGYLSALDFINAVIKEGYIFPTVFPYVPAWPNEVIDSSGIMIKYFDTGHAEANWLRDALRNAVRIEFIVGILFDCVTVKLSFFGKGNVKDHILETAFQKESGKVVIISRIL